MRVGTLVLALVPLMTPVLGHIALWDPSMFGWDPNDPNQMEPVLPLAHLNFDEWWFHSYKNKPPAAGNFMTLPSGGTYKAQVACNKALTTFGQNPAQQTGIWACEGEAEENGTGARHSTDKLGTPNPVDVKGCGISIAYVSDENEVQPEDFTVISTNYTCPWFKHVDFQIPSDLPACPSEGCLCSWGWIHSIDGGSQQNYHLVYRCKVDGASGTVPLPRANIANKCNFPEDTSNCTVGAKQPHYWFQNERNNNPQGEYDPPFYNGEYGYINGAQTDLFAASGGSGNEAAVAPSSSVVIPSAPVISVSTTISAAVNLAPTTTASPTSASNSSASVQFASTSKVGKCRRKRSTSVLEDRDGRYRKVQRSKRLN